LKITAEPLPERQVRLEIEVEDERHNDAVERAYRKLAPRVQIAGFRPGKAPRPLIERQLGRPRLLDEAMDILVPEVYREAIEEQNLEPVANPDLEIVSHEPFVFKATVPLRPAIDLGDYTSIRAPFEKLAVTDEQVEESVRDLRRRYGTIEPVERPAAKGDRIRADIHAEADGTVLFDEHDTEYALSEEAFATFPGLLDQIIGKEKGADFEAKVEMAADFADERLAGKTVDFHIVIHEVKEEKLAELDDAFAKEVGEGFENVASLRQHVRDDLQKASDDAATRAFQEVAVDAIVAQATVDSPAVLLEHEIDHVLEEEANLDPRDPRAQEIYLGRLGKSEDEVRESVREEAERRLRRSLVLSQFAEAENIKVADDDVDAELEQMASQAGEQADAIRQIFGTEAARDTLRRSVFTRRVLDRLVEITSGGESTAAATTSTASSEEEEKPARRRRTGPRQVE
jgi:trigger factor